MQGSKTGGFFQDIDRVKTAYRIYTRIGTCLQLSRDGKRLQHAPSGICAPNLLATLSDRCLKLLDIRGSEARWAGCDLDLDDNSAAGPVTLAENAHLEATPTPNGTVTIRLGQFKLRVGRDGRCSLSGVAIDRTCEFLLVPSSDMVRAVDTIALADDDRTDLFCPTLDFPEIAHFAERLVTQGEFSHALELLLYTVQANCFLPRFKGRSLFIRDLDRVLQTISDALWAEMPSPLQDGGDVRLIIATEIYVAGGHTRIIEDIADTFPASTLLLTDCFRNIEQGHIDISYFGERLPKTKIIRLGSSTLLDKTKHLIRFVRETKPHSIYFLSHHQDPIPFAALSSDRVHGRRIFVHHTDHNPSLGVTYGSFEHFDCTRHVGTVCSCILGGNTRYLPLSVADEGVSSFACSKVLRISTVTAGNVVKFARDGHCSYPNMVAAVLSSIDGCHYHIGQLPPDWIAAIYDRLARHGIERDRFVYLGVVPSLWQTIKSLDAQVYLASAPTPGTRAAIEAQGAGLPTLFFRNASVEPLLRMREMYASQDLGWSSISDIPKRLFQVSEAYTAYAHAARRHYEENYSRRAFEDAII